MRALLPVSRLLHPFLLFLLSVLLIGVVAVAANPARAADDCSSFVREACLRERISANGTVRVLTVNVLRQNKYTEYYNVIIPEQGQTRVEPGKSFALTVPGDGKVVYSIEACGRDLLNPSMCTPWKQIVRNFGPVAGAPAQPPPPPPPPPPPVPQKPVKSIGKSGGPKIPGGVLSCRGGGGMRVTISSQTAIFVAFTPAAQPANTAQPGAGQCAWPDRPFTAGEARRFALDPGKPNAQLVMDAVRTGGTFQLTASPVGTFIMVSAINNVQVMDSTPLSPGPVTTDSGDDIPQTPADMGGMRQQAGGACGDGNAVATVVINQAGLDKLNVRNGPGGEVLGTVPEGSTVSVAGPCGSTGGTAGFVAQANKPGGGNGWCQISAPVHGCVSAQFLDFGGGDVTTNNGAAGLVMSQPKGGGTPAAANFSGRWSANAEDVAYSISLRQKGSGVSGSYQGNDGSVGKINGKVSGNVLRFAWVQTDGTRGSGKFALSADGRSFNGSYSMGNNPDVAEGSWNGMRQ